MEENIVSECKDILLGNTSKDKDLVSKEIECELWREYDFGGRNYRIDNPVSLHYRPTGTTHRVVDVNGVAHCVPAPGEKGCVLRWKNKYGLDRVNF